MEKSEGKTRGSPILPLLAVMIWWLEDRGVERPPEEADRIYREMALPGIAAALEINPDYLALKQL